MDIINNASITREEGGMKTETFMASYSPEEQEQNQINAANAELVYSPEFIPFYRSIQLAYKLTDKETLVYGFIRFYLSTSANKRFYFSDKQLAAVVGCGEDKAQEALKVLRRNGLIESSNKIRAGGGQIRFITRVRILPNTGVELLEKTGRNNNKIKENKNNNYLRDVSSNDSTSLKEISIKDTVNIFGTEYEVNTKHKIKFVYPLQEKLVNILEHQYPRELTGISDRRALQGLWEALHPRYGKDEWMDKNPFINLAEFIDAYTEGKEPKLLVGTIYNLATKIRDCKMRGTFNFTAQKNEQERI